MWQKTRREWLFTLCFVALSTTIIFSPLLELPFKGVNWQEYLQLPSQLSMEQQSSPVQEVAPTPTPSPLPEENEGEIAPGEEPEIIPITQDNLWPDLVWPLLQFLLLFIFMAFFALSDLRGSHRDRVLCDQAFNPQISHKMRNLPGADAATYAGSRQTLSRCRADGRGGGRFCVSRGVDLSPMQSA